MTDAQTIDRQDTLYITDAELIRRMGVPEKKARHVIRSLDADRLSGFPRKDPFFGGRRYWPAVRAYLDRRNRVNVETSTTKRGSG